jgi:hypothetical protein
LVLRRCAWLALVSTVGACSARNPAYQPDSAVRVDVPVDLPPLPEAGLPADSSPSPPPAPDGGSAPDLAPDLPPPPPELSCPDDKDLAACFRFEMNTTDEGASHLGTARAVSVAYEAGPQGFALRSTADTRLETVSTTSLDATRLTMELWVKPRVLPTGTARAALIDYERQYSIFVHPGGAVWCRIRGVDDVIADGVLTAGIWSSVACTVDGSAVVVWIDGKARASRPLAPLETPSGTGGMGLGCNIPSADFPNADAFEGSIDNVRIWKRVRTPDELCAAALSCP